MLLPFEITQNSFLILQHFTLKQYFSVFFSIDGSMEILILFQLLSQIKNAINKKLFLQLQFIFYICKKKEHIHSEIILQKYFFHYSQIYSIIS